MIARIRAIAAMEWAVQRRDPLTALLPLVLALLAIGYTSGGPVELVPSRGAVPRTAPWAIALATTGLVAFAQVLTTMLTATVVLRDRAVGMDVLLATGALTRREYLAGKLAAAIGILSLVQLAIPLGLLVGVALHEGASAALAPPMVAAVARPTVLLVVPVLMSVGLLQFAMGALVGRLWAIVGQGLVLLWLWGTVLGAAERGVASPPTWLDPFASAPLVAATRAWPDAERLVAAMPIDADWALGRLVWFAVGVAAVALTFARATIAAPVAAMGDGGARDGEPVARPDGAASAAAAGDAWRRTIVAPLGAVAVARAVAAYTARWMLRDPGWRVLAALGAINVGVQAGRVALPVDGSAVTAALAVLVEHGRLFLILLATIYAGELVWREREQRSAPLLDVLPVGTRAATIGGLAGVVTAQVVLVAALAATVWGVVALRGDAPDPIVFTAAVAVRLLAPFVAWMLLAWALHVALDHKIVAHLGCIAAWVVVVTLDGRVRDAVWWRALAWPEVVAGAPFALADATRTAALWWAGGAAAVLLLLPRVVRGAR